MLPFYANGTGTNYYRGDTILNLTAAPDGEVTLYPQWVEPGTFGIFESMYSIWGQTFGYDYGINTPVDALYDASRPQTGGPAALDLDTADRWGIPLGNGHLRVKKTGDLTNPVALYLYDSNGDPLTVEYAPEGSLIGSGNNDGLTQACKQSLQSLYGPDWADGLVTVGNITMLWSIDDEASLNPGGDVGFVLASVNGVGYFISGRYAYPSVDTMVSQFEPGDEMIEMASASWDAVLSVHEYIAGPMSGGGY